MGDVDLAALERKTMLTLTAAEAAFPRGPWFTITSAFLQAVRLARRSADLERDRDELRSAYSSLEQQHVSTVYAQGEHSRDRAALTAARARIAEMEGALKPFADMPERGIHGGPLTCAVGRYEDGTEPHPGFRCMLAPHDFDRARTLLQQEDANG